MYLIIVFILELLSVVKLSYSNPCSFNYEKGNIVWKKRKIITWARSSITVLAARGSIMDEDDTLKKILIPLK